VADRLVDAGLAAAALVATLAVAAALSVSASALALGVGVVGALFVEAVLQRHHAAVRRAWGRPTVKAAAVVAFLLALAVVAVVAPAPGLSLFGGGLVGYLALLAGTAVGDAVGR
jgi:hypothetical protein